jgi:hypothetical protein
MVNLKSSKVNVQAHAEETRQQALAETPDFERVSWTTDPSIRKLYINCALGLLIGSATTGYDGYVNCRAKVLGVSGNRFY